MQRITLDAGDGTPVVVFVPESEVGGGGNGGGVDLKPPAAPTEVTATLARDTGVDVSWFDASDNETSFRVELESRGSGNPQLAQSHYLPAGSTRTTFDGLAPAHEYALRVSAVNDSGVATSNDVTFVTKTPVPVDNGGDPLKPTPGGPIVSTIAEATAAKYLAPGFGMVAAKISSPDDRVVDVTFYIDGKADRSQRGDAPPFNFAFHSLTSGEHTFHVVATDSKGRRGVAVRTIQVVENAQDARVFAATPGTLQGFLDGARPGDVVVVRGKHTGHYRVSKGGAEGAPVQIRFEPGASIDARGAAFALTPGDPTKPQGGAQWVSIFDPLITGASNGNGGHNSALILGNDWYVHGGIVTGTDGTGVGMNGVRCGAFGLTAQRNGQNGISSTRGQFVAVVGCTSDGNNTKKNNPASEGGGGKYARANYTINDSCTFSNNIGPGLWHDINNGNYTVCRCLFDHNVARDSGKAWQGAGYRTEISQGPGVVCTNVFKGNDGSGMSIDEAMNFTAYGNEVRDGGGGAEFRNLKRNDNDNAIMGIKLTRNRFVNLKVGIATSSATAPGYEWTTSRPKDWRMTIDENEYTKVGAPIVWAGKTYRAATTFGVETSGTFN